MKRVFKSTNRATLGIFAQIALTFSLLTATTAIAEPVSDKPDLYMVAGRDWRVVLPISVLAATQDPPVPILLPEEGKERWFEHFIDRYRPKRPVLVHTLSEDESSGSRLPWASGPPFPEVEGKVIKPLRINLESKDIALALAKKYYPRVDGEDVGPSVWLVDVGNYSAALLAAVAAGSQRGVLLPIAANHSEIDAALQFAQQRNSRVFLAQGGAEISDESRDSRFKALVEARAKEISLSIETLGNSDALVKAALEGFSALLDSSVRPGGTEQAISPAQQDQSNASRLPSHLVITNPSDTQGIFSPPYLSLLSPLFAIARNAPLILTRGEPEDLDRDLQAYEERYTSPSHITLVGDYLSLKMWEMVDPDDLFQGVEEPRVFRVPSLTGVMKKEPAEYAVGRLATEDVHDLSLQLGRIITPNRSFGLKKRPALMLANADNIFVMAELVSMATVNEMENVGWGVEAYYGDKITRGLIRETLPGKEVIIWTGHPRDLTVDYDIGEIDQRLDAALVFLQGCYTFHRSDAYVFAKQGAASIIGSYMAVYSASGSAFAKTVLDAMLYYGADQGEAMVHARNFLLAYVAMKKQRGHEDWRKTWRASLSFELWGDPSATTVPPRMNPALTPLQLHREGDILSFSIPDDDFDRVTAGRYALDNSPGGQLGAIYYRRDDKEQDRHMIPFYFGWVDLKERDKEPVLTSDLPDRDWVSLWTPKRRRLYLLVHSRARDNAELEGISFEIQPEPVEAPKKPHEKEEE